MPFPVDKQKEFTKKLRAIECYDDFRALQLELSSAGYYFCVGDRNAIGNVSRVGGPHSDRITFSLIDLSGKSIVENAYVAVQSLQKFCSIGRR